MSEALEQSRLEQTRRSTRSRVSRRSLSQTGLPLDLTPVTAGVKGRAGKLGFTLAALLGLLVLALLLVRPGREPLPASGAPVAYLELSRGSVQGLPAGAVGDTTRLLPLAPGAPLRAGDVIETGAAPGRAALRLGDSVSVRLDEETRLQVASTSAVVLDRGAVYLDAAGDGTSIEVRTALGVVREVGTQFEVRIADGEAASLRVRVREGKIILRHRQQSYEAGVGEELALDDDGNLSRAAVPIYGAHWDWVLESAPLPEIEGSDLRTFLEWFTREGGWTLQFTDPQLATRASTIILHGDAQGLEPPAAAAMALQGSGLAYHVEENVLVIGRAAGGK